MATSLDGFIADRDGGIEWLHSISNPNMDDMGYVHFMSDIEALVMGRTTFETIGAFEGDWPYTKKVFVLSNKLKEVPLEYKDKVELINGPLKHVLETLHYGIIIVLLYWRFTFHKYTRKTYS